MAQKKKDFTAAAAAAFDNGGSIVDRILQTADPAAPEHAAAVPAAGYLPQKRYTYQNRAETEVRVTFMISKDSSEKMRRLCFAANCKQKHVIEAALQMYFADYEAKHGKLL